MMTTLPSALLPDLNFSWRNAWLSPTISDPAPLLIRKEPSFPWKPLGYQPAIHCSETVLAAEVVKKSYK